MDILASIKEKSPFIYNMTSEVAAHFTANGLIAIGASPAVSSNSKEAIEMATKADAVVLNTGALSSERAEAMVLAGEAANDAGVPVILDPVAVGATKFRTKLINKMLSTIKFSAICANAGEIAVLAGVLEKTTSPDNQLQENDPSIVEKVANKYRTIVISTEEVDVITDGTRTSLCKNGHKMLQNITASGCLLTSIIGAFVSVSKGKPYEASIDAVAAYTIAAEKAVIKSLGPGSFLPFFLDELYLLDGETMKAKQIIEVTI